MNKTPFSLLLIVLLGALAQGCAPSFYAIKQPIPSNKAFVSIDDSATNIVVTDARNANQKNFSYGVLQADLMLDGNKLDPIQFLKENTIKELTARGLNSAIQDDANVRLDINKLEMRNHRTNAYTPFITLTFLSADLSKGENKERIGVFIKRGKVPVWSFDEVIEPTLNQPLDLLVKEFSAKIIGKLNRSKMSDEDVETLVSKVTQSKITGSTYLDVYQLGFSNNPKAIKPVFELSRSEDEYVRMAAISSLGILGATEHLGYLKGLAENSRTWADRAMALKAIGDIGGESAIEYLKQTKVRKRKKNNKKEKEKIQEKNKMRK